MADLNKLARRIVDEATEPKEEPARVRGARKGGKRGGKARAEKLSPERRSEIAKKAARARWG